jgi:hypothetical protein
MIESLWTFAQRHVISLGLGFLVALVVFGTRYLNKRRAHINRSASDSVTPDAGGEAPPRNRGGTHGPGGGPDE